MADVKARLESKKKRLESYIAREALMLSEDGVQSYGVGSRNVQRYNTDLGVIRKAIEELEHDIDELEAMVSGKSSRRLASVIPRDC